MSYAALIGNPADETLDYKEDITRPCCASRGQRVILVDLLVFGAGWFSLPGHGFKGPYFGASIAGSSCGMMRMMAASRYASSSSCLFRCRS